MTLDLTTLEKIRAEVEKHSKKEEIPYTEEGISKEDAIKSIEEWVAKLLPCPFCGQIPTIKYRVDEKHSIHGSLGHFVTRELCCDSAGSKTDLFFCNDNTPANYGLWANMVKWIVFNWNERKEITNLLTYLDTEIAKLKSV